MAFRDGVAWMGGSSGGGGYSCAFKRNLTDLSPLSWPPPQLLQAPFKHLRPYIVTNYVKYFFRFFCATNGTKPNLSCHQELFLFFFLETEKKDDLLTWHSFPIFPFALVLLCMHVG